MEPKLFKNWIPVFVSGTWILDSHYSGIPDSLGCIPDSTNNIFLEPDFTGKMFLDFWIQTLFEFKLEKVI